MATNNTSEKSRTQRRNHGQRLKYQETINLKAELNKTETKRTMQRNNKTKNWLPVKNQ